MIFFSHWNSFLTYDKFLANENAFEEMYVFLGDKILFQSAKASNNQITQAGSFSHILIVTLHDRNRKR